MQALFLDSGGLSWRTDLPVPVPAPGYALIRVERAGICSTDQQLLRGMYRFQGIPGHEFVGTVEAVSPELMEATSWIGQRVVGEINIACGSCDFCLRGLVKHCRHRRVLGIRQHPGAFADYLTLPLKNLHAVPHDLSVDAAVWIEPLAAALDILARIDVAGRSSVAVVGDGRIAQLATRVLLKSDIDVKVFGHHAEKLDRLPAAARTALQPDSSDLRQFDAVVECSGSRSGLETALQLVRPLGRVILKSTLNEPVPLSTEDLVVNEITVLGSRCGDFTQAIGFLQAEQEYGVNNPAQKKDQTLAGLVDAHFEFKDGLAAFDYLRRAPVIKVVLDIA